MLIAVALLAGLVLGALAAWFVGRSLSKANTESLADLQRQQAELVASKQAVEEELARLEREFARVSERLSTQQEMYEAQLRQMQSGFDEQKRLLIEEVEPRWKGFFKSESREALEENRTDFMREAQQSIQPLNEKLRKLEEQIGKLGNTEVTLQEQLRQLQTGTTDLIYAIRGKPQLRGNWGELVLRDIVEFVGMVDRCHFFEQQAIEDGRPDMVINLPQNRQVAVDSKHVVEAFWPVAEAANSGDTGAYLAARKEFAGKVRRRLDELSKREYWKKVGGNLDFVIMFLPAEAHYREAIDADNGLMEYAAKSNVLLLSPLTLLALLRMMASSWREQKQIEFAHEMIQEAKRFYERVERFHTRLLSTGQAIDNLIGRYDDAVTAWDGKQGVMRLAERVGKLGAGDGKPVPEIPLIDRTTRPLEAAIQVSLPTAEA